MEIFLWTEWICGQKGRDAPTPVKICQLLLLFFIGGKIAVELFFFFYCNCV